jgi:hypothetical protein
MLSLRKTQRITFVTLQMARTKCVRWVLVSAGGRGTRDYAWLCVCPASL